jgi:hypothetical protein
MLVQGASRTVLNPKVRANKAQKARIEKDPAKIKRFLQEAALLKRRCFRDPEEKMRNLRSRIAQELGLKETGQLDMRAFKATSDNLQGEGWARRVLGMEQTASRPASPAG